MCKIIPDDKDRGVFSAVNLVPDGWVVLMPWITNPSGYWWRPHMAVCGYGEKAERYAKHYEAELNRECMNRAAAFVRSLDPLEAECEWVTSEEIAYAVRDYIAEKLRECTVSKRPFTTDELGSIAETIDATRDRRIALEAEMRIDSLTHERDEAWRVRDRALQAIRDALEAVQNLPSGIDWDADPNDPCPEDCSAHVGGLVAQILREALPGEENDE